MGGTAGSAIKSYVNWKISTMKRIISVSYINPGTWRSIGNVNDIDFKLGVHFVKINDKKMSKQYNIKTYPALTYFRNKEPIAYEGKLNISPTNIGLRNHRLLYVQAICWMRNKSWNSWPVWKRWNCPIKSKKSTPKSWRKSSMIRATSLSSFVRIKRTKNF